MLRNAEVLGVYVKPCYCETSLDLLEVDFVRYEAQWAVFSSQVQINQMSALVSIIFAEIDLLWCPL